MRAGRMAVAIMLIGFWAGIAGAQQTDGALGVEAGVSSLGAYVAPSMSLSDQTRLRLPIYGGALSGDFDADGTTVLGDLRSRQMGLVADYDVYHGLYLSAGLLIGGYRLSGQADHINADGRDIAGHFLIEVKQQHQLAPVVALGYRYGFGGGVSFRAELGAKIVKHTLQVNGLEPLSPVDRSDAEAEIARLNDDLQDYPAIPYLTLAFGIVF